MPSLVEIGPVVLEKKIFKSCQFIFIISQLSPLWEGRGPSFQQSRRADRRGTTGDQKSSLAFNSGELKIRFWF